MQIKLPWEPGSAALDLRRILTTLHVMRGDKRPPFCRWRVKTELEGRESEINEIVAYSNSFRCLFMCVSE